MKKLIFVCILMMTVALGAGASAEMVSVAELHDQAEALGGVWQKSYETPKGTLEVNAPIIVPDVETMPVITVERAKPLTQELFDEIAADKRTSRNQKEILYVSDVDGQEKEYFLGYEENGVGGYEAVDYVSMQVGKYRIDETEGRCSIGAVEPKTYHFAWELDLDEQHARGLSMTANGAVELLREEIKRLYPNEEMDVSPSDLTIKGSLLAENLDKGKKWREPGDYSVSVEQYMCGTPIIGSLASRAGAAFHVRFTSTQATNRQGDKLDIYRTGVMESEPRCEVTAQDAENYRTQTMMARLRTVEIVDVPLASLDQVMMAIEKEIDAGRILHIYSLRLGYLLYSDPEMTDHAWAIPRWVMECSYVGESNKDIVEWQKKHKENDTEPFYAYSDFYCMPIDAQTGEPIIFTIGDEATFSVPKMTTWDDAK